MTDFLLSKVGDALHWFGESLYDHWRVYVAVVVTAAVMKGCGL